MRRFSLLLLAALLPALLVACGGGGDSKTPTTASSAASPSSTNTTASSATPTRQATPGTSAGAAGTTATAASQPTAPAPAATGQAQTPSAGTGAGTGTGTGSGSAVPTVAPRPDDGQTQVASGDFAYGFNVFWRGDENGADYNKRTIQEVTGAGFNWVRIQVQWKEIEPAKNQWDPRPLDRLLEQAQGSNVKILASVVKAPDWAIDTTGNQFLKDYADWEGFMHFLAERYRGKIQAWEIWNEQNLAHEMGGTVRLLDYCRLLEGGYNGVKKADPDAIVVFGGLTPNGVNDPKIAIDDVQYLRSFYNFQGGYYRKFFDVLGMHVSATNNPPDYMYPDKPGTGDWSNHPSFYFRRAEQLKLAMIENGDPRPAWITEFGWTTANQAKGYEYGASNSEQDQADYLVGAFDYAKANWPWMTGMFVWNLNFSTISPPTDEKFPWSVVNADWSPRPAYDALRKMPKG